MYREKGNLKRIKILKNPSSPASPALPGVSCTFRFVKGTVLKHTIGIVQ